jgi:hypothetical protein
MGQYRKKPVVIEAVQVPAFPVARSVPVELDDLAMRCGGAVLTNTSTGEFCIDIPTLEGTMRALAGDWIIRGVNGEFYPCKPDIFAKTYEAV